MKINDVLLVESQFDEGALDKWNTLKAGIAGAKAGYTSSVEQRAGQEKLKAVAATFIKDWSEAIAQDPSANTPDLLKQFMHNSTRKSGITVPEPPQTLNDVNTAQYITQVIGQALAASRIGPKADIDSEVPQDQEAEKSAADKPVPEKPDLSPGFSMLDDDPVTIRYKNKDFARNDRGQWAPVLTPNKPIVDSAVIKLFDKQEIAIEDWKSLQPGAPAAEPRSSAPAAPPAAPDYRSPKSITDPSKEVFVKGHGVVQKQDDGSWKSLVSNATVADSDWPALDKMLPASSSAPASTDTTLPGAPLASTVKITDSASGINVTFIKSEAGWSNKDTRRSGTMHTPGTEGYDALERTWARENGQPEPEPTVTSAEPAMTESFKRLNRITHGKL